jgi:hypothetical protein
LLSASQVARIVDPLAEITIAATYPVRLGFAVIEILSALRRCGNRLAISRTTLSTLSDSWGPMLTSVAADLVEIVRRHSRAPVRWILSM